MNEICFHGRLLPENITFNEKAQIVSFRVITKRTIFDNGAEQKITTILPVCVFHKAQELFKRLKEIGNKSTIIWASGYLKSERIIENGVSFLELTVRIPRNRLTLKVL